MLKLAYIIWRQLQKFGTECKTKPATSGNLSSSAYHQTPKFPLLLLFFFFCFFSFFFFCFFFCFFFLILLFLLLFFFFCFFFSCFFSCFLLFSCSSVFYCPSVSSSSVSHFIFLLLALQLLAKLSLFQNCPPLFSVLRLSSPVPHAHLL